MLGRFTQLEQFLRGFQNNQEENFKQLKTSYVPETKERDEPELNIAKLMGLLKVRTENAAQDELHELVSNPLTIVITVICLMIVLISIFLAVICRRCLCCKKNISVPLPPPSTGTSVTWCTSCHNHRAFSEALQAARDFDNQEEDVLYDSVPLEVP